MIHLGDPAFLLLLLPLAALVLWRRRRAPGSVDGASAEVFGGLPVSLRQRTAWLPGLLATLACVLLIVALSRPQRGREETRVITEGVDIMLVVDTSSSMLQDGLERGVTNIAVVKEVLAGFVRGRQDDKLGLVTFAALPRTACPLTLDNDAVLRHLAAVHCVNKSGPEDGTGIGVALGHAARKLMDSEAASKVVVLLTDGIENQFVIPPEDAAELCADLDVRVYIIGAGVIRAPRMFGGVEEQELPMEMLELVAERTGGKAYRARNAQVLELVYAEIDALEKTQREDVRYTDYDDIYTWFLIPAAALLALELLLRRSVFLELVG
ncbi:MAG: aerotolerance regulator BatA [Planctomycetota bacterium]|nr:MAG: aerotolerance regulator BatA [Planctomycetota bacterium]